MQALDTIAEAGSPERSVLDRIDPSRLPRHIAIIMDGNGRWARARNLPRVEGHRAGIRAVRDTAETVARLGIETVTLYAFSTENWKRPRAEVATLMRLLERYLVDERQTMIDNRMRFRPIGNVAALAPEVRRQLDAAIDATSGCTGTTLQLALNYSGRQELVEMARAAARDAAVGRLDPGEIDEAWVDSRLQTAGSPDPDLLVRTSGEQRISNFLLWQLAYTEIVFSPVLWPDFRARHLLEAIVEFQHRDRRFGGVAVGDAEGVFAPPGATDGS